jgi:adenylate kinase
MAPIKEDTVNDLKDLVAKLESRVRQLEDRLGDGESKSKTPLQSMRMILMGPPGAGEHRRHTAMSHGARLMPSSAGKGTQAPKIKDKYCVCHLVRKHMIPVFALVRLVDNT